MDDFAANIVPIQTNQVIHHSYRLVNSNIWTVQSKNNVLLPLKYLPQHFQRVDRRRVLPRHAVGDVDYGIPQQRQARMPKEPDQSVRRMTQHRVQQVEVRVLQLVRRDGQDDVHRLPEQGVRKRVAAADLVEVAQRDGGVPGAQARHALDMLLLRDERATRFNPPPAQRLLALLRPLVA